MRDLHADNRMYIESGMLEMETSGPTLTQSSRKGALLPTLVWLSTN